MMHETQVYGVGFFVVIYKLYNAYRGSGEGGLQPLFSSGEGGL